MDRLYPPFPKEIPQVHTSNFVSWHDVDFQGFLSLYSLFNFAQATAWKHAEELGFGFEQLGDNKLAWVLFGMRIKLLKDMPKWQENIEIQTQPKGLSGMFANRDYRMLNNQGDLIAIGSSNWLIIDTEKRRPQRLDHLYDSLRFVENPDNLITRLKPIGKFPYLLDSHAVKTSDIDYYGHVNNAKYISWIMDLYTPNQLEQNSLDEILVNFQLESRFGDEIAIYADKQDNKEKVRYKMQRKSDEKVILMAEIDWK